MNSSDYQQSPSAGDDTSSNGNNNNNNGRSSPNDTTHDAEPTWHVPRSSKLAPTTAPSFFDQQFPGDNHKLQLRIFNIDGLHPNGNHLTQPMVERVAFGNSECTRLTFNEMLQGGILYFPTEKHATEFLLRAPKVCNFSVVKYHHVNHPNTYFTIVCTPVPDNWHVTDLIDYLNKTWGSDSCHFISGKQYENNSASSKHLYCFINSDNREVCEMLFTISPIRIPGPPGSPPIIVHIDRAPDRRDSVNTFRVTGIPYFMTELAAKQFLAHHANISEHDIDHIYRPKNHVTGEVAEYGYGKATSIEAYDHLMELAFRTIKYMGFEIRVHDIASEKKQKTKQQREQVVGPYRPKDSNSTPVRRLASAQHQVPTSYAAAVTQSAPALMPAAYPAGNHQQVATPPATHNTTCTTTAASTPAASDDTLLRILASIDGIKKDFRLEIEQLRNEIFDQDQGCELASPPPVPPVYSSDTTMSDATAQAPQDDELTLTKKQKTADV
jgi:hypothetical protein